MNNKFTKHAARYKAIRGDFGNVYIKNVGSLSEYIDKNYPNSDKVIDYFEDGSYWYRLYDSGWIEQGGTFTATAGTTVVTLLKEMYTANYFVDGNYQNSTDSQYGQCYNLTTTNFTMKTYASRTLNWQVKGFIKKD